MNIIILTDRYHPNPVSSAILAYDLAIELNQQGQTLNRNNYIKSDDHGKHSPIRR